MCSLPTSRIRSFRSEILSFYRKNGRDLPWRRTRDPYHILVSEFMLQQTQVHRVLVKYRSFLERFPTVTALAKAPLIEVLGAWQGLGYNRRAAALKRTAELIVECYGGSVPDGAEELEALPGIGHATASCILAFAFERPVAFIETNIRSVYIHFFFPGRREVRDDEILPLVERTVDTARPREWYYALMDYGVMLKRSTGNPSARSAHHKVQAPFRGSTRELRGSILRSLVARREATARSLAADAKRSVEETARALGRLIAEGIVVKKARRFAVSSGEPSG